jgi:hypothetical protein
VLACLAAFAGQAAVVYKWTAPDGVVHYSDQPVPGAEKIFTASGPTPAGPASSGPPTPQAAPASKKNGPLSFNQLAITSPAPDQTFFGDEVISVQLALDPSLQPNQTITWHLNGKPLLQEPTTTQFVLPHLDRGTYAIAATIGDQQTGESVSTNSVTFFVHQPSELSPQHRKP